MRTLFLILILAVVAILIWLFQRWVRAGLSRNEGKSNDAEHYASLLTLYAQDCARHLDAAQNPERSWQNRMERLNKAEEAKRKHVETLVEAPTDMRGQDLEHPPSSEIRSLRQELFNRRKGDPDLPRNVLRNHEKTAHARMLERAAAHLHAYGKEEEADELETLAEEIYRELITHDSSSITPYLRLAEIYRHHSEIDRETDVLQRGLEQADFESDEQREKVQKRLEQIRELRGA